MRVRSIRVLLYQSFKVNLYFQPQVIKFAFNDINVEDLAVRRIELAQMERPDPRLHVFMQGRLKKVFKKTDYPIARDYHI